MRTSAVAFLALLALPFTSWGAQQGEIVWVDPSCDHFIAKIGEEFGTFNYRSGAAPSLGDRIEGELLNLEGGERPITNLTSGAVNGAYPLSRSSRLYVMIHTAPVQCKERFKGAAR